jgi:hypothetical protein
MIIVWLICVMLGSFFLGMLVEGLCQAAAKPAPKPQICTRRAPHICTVNGPCNGFPRLPIGYFDKMKDGSLAHAYRVDLTAEGRPTMPSEVEPELEMERRTR